MPVFHDDLFDGESKPIVHRYCCPILIAGANFAAFIEPAEHVLVQRGKELPRLRSGTLTFVLHEGEVYGLTCAHVVDALEQSIVDAKSQLESACGGEVPYPPEVWNRFFFPADDKHLDLNVKFERASDPNIDIAASWIPPDIFSEIGRRAIDINPGRELPEQWPADAGALACGYPEVNRRIHTRLGPDDTIAFANVTLRSDIEKPSGGRIRMFGSLDPKEATEVDVLSGMSGGPIVVTCGDRWGLAGIVSGGADLNSYAKPGSQGFFDSPAINIEGEALTLPHFRTWLDSLKGQRSGRMTKHVQIRRVGGKTIIF